MVRHAVVVPSLIHPVDRTEAFREQTTLFQSPITTHTWEFSSPALRRPLHQTHPEPYLSSGTPGRTHCMETERWSGEVQRWPTLSRVEELAPGDPSCPHSAHTPPTPPSLPPSHLQVSRGPNLIALISPQCNMGRQGKTQQVSILKQEFGRDLLLQ